MPQTATPPSTLAANLGCLGERNAELARKLGAVGPRRDVTFAETPQEVLSVVAAGTPLCSRHRPLDEASRLAEGVDVIGNAVAVVLGFGAGYHVRALAERLDGSGVIIVFEPDLGLLRAVLERIDHTAWMKAAQLLFVTDADDRGALARKLEGAESIIAQGVVFVEHPPSRRRIGEQSRRFMPIVTELVNASKITFMTTLLRAVDTVRNLLLNLGHYAGGPGITDLQDAATGRLGIVVSAGPSLQRSLDLLARPQVRERAVIIAAQTTLRPLLAAGVRPHFVTALDFHEISRRFYEDLTPQAVRDVTLIAEPKAHPVILDAFPGTVRCCANEFLDDLLGEHRRPMGVLPAGSTVAHLAVYVARWLGCNPIAMVGQDLAFTDGLYYTPGTAIDDVWAPELNPFNTMEMMQWQRIARHRLHLSRMTDVHGRSVFSDAQMLTYLQQFERDFAGYREAGIEIIDATEGGLVKQHTTAMPLAEVLDRYATSPLPPLPAPPVEPDSQRLAAVRKRVASVGSDVRIIRETSLKTARLLRRMIRDLGNPAKMQRHFAALEPHRTAIDQRVTAFGLVNHLNQLGVYKRHRADRRLHMQPDISPRDRQLAQIQRDLDNVNWTADAAGEIAHQLALTDRVLAGEQIAPAAGSSTALLNDVSVGEGPARVAALVPIDPDRNGLGVRRSLVEPFGKHRSVLQATLERLGQAHKLDSIVLIAPEGFDVDAIIDRDRIGRSVHVHRCDGSPYGPEQEAIAAARRWSVTSWRGGIAGMSVYDEVLCPALMHRAMRQRGLTAALVAGPDWPLIDPDDDTGCNAIIARHLELPDQHKLVFNQAPPGLAGCIVSAGIMEELTLRNRLSTIGGLLVYQPHAPQHDPIARSINVQIDHSVRRSRVRATFDAPRYRKLLDGALGSPAANLNAAAIVEKLARYAAGNPDELPRHVVVELCTRRTSDAAHSETASRSDLEPQLAARLFEQIATAGDVVVTFAGAGDPLLHDRFDEILRLARDAGVLGVHVRTELLVGQPTLDRLLACEPDVVSVDLNADCPETYRRIMGLDRYQDVVSGMHYLVTQRTPLTDHSATASLALPWIVPRLARCADTANDLDGFFQRWQATLGTAVIDPEPAGHDNPLLAVVVPPAVGLDDARHTMTVHSDGSIPVDDDPGHSVGSIARTPVVELWPQLLRHREQRTENDEQ